MDENEIIKHLRHRVDMLEGELRLTKDNLRCSRGLVEYLREKLKRLKIVRLDELDARTRGRLRAINDTYTRCNNYGLEK